MTGTTIRISKKTQEKLNIYCIKRFHVEIKYMNKDYVLETFMLESKIDLSDENLNSFKICS